MTWRMSSGSSRAESAVEPTRSENITVSWRRSAASTGAAGDPLTAVAGDPGTMPPASEAAAFSRLLKKTPEDSLVFIVLV